MWIIFFLLCAGYWLWRSNKRRAERFVRAVHFLEALDSGASINEANGRVARLFSKQSNANLDVEAIAFAMDRAQRWTEGKQLPWIHEARLKGFVVDSGSSMFDAAHLSGKGK